MLDAICKRFGKTHLLFTSVLNTNLAEKLRGFSPKMIFWDKVGEEMLCLEGEWELI